MLNNTGKRIGIILVALATIAFSTYFSSSISRQESIADLSREAAYHLDLLRASLFAPTDKFSYLPEVVANHSIILDAVKHADDPAYLERANQFLEQTNSTAKSAVIYVLDRSGLVIAASNWQEPDSFVGQNYAFRPYFQDGIANRRGRFYGMGTTSLRPGYYLSYPVSVAKKVIGVAVVKIDMSDLDEGWGGSRNEVTVADGNGVIFLSSRPEWKYRPMQKLTPEATKQLQSTRQYDKVLMPSLPMALLQRLQGGERIVEVGRGDTNDNVPRTRYLLKSGTLPGSDWTIHVFAPMAQVDMIARRVALITAGALALLALALLYLHQMLDRAREREKSRKALEEAHQALERKHLELQDLSEELRIASITDPLTGAYNRRFFFETIPKLVSASTRHGFPLSFIAIDIDHFKRINDMYGHPVGDLVLQALTGICKDSLREADVFARFGGEEFMMALPNTSTEEARLVADRLRLLVMNHPAEIRGDALVIRISCGVSQCRSGEDSAAAALKRADDALYIAKANGRNQVVVQ
ncbi:MAG TPA: diguanylate cyclase [Noviherbaspirillum sp.]|uniref:sensor domain-containing diguanylate cyclase n=1 Tax=Noviherbaspirillum sp. TaxID=1926288 RepID=UPI002B47D795|nr:diguanylate cyclase [Noviherbaspirillum sp.]HJV84402.1 diguanylate cyclase [Noviherbaspirillum sp.]